MSLYNNTSNQLTGAFSLTGSVKSLVGGAVGSLGGAIADKVGGGLLVQAGASLVGNMAANAAVGLVNKHIPPSAQRAIGTGVGMLSDLKSGNVIGAGLKLLDSGLLDGVLSGQGGNGFMGRSNPLFGGITPARAKMLYENARGQEHAKKNLFLVEVESRLDGASVSEVFNMFVIGLDYEPFTVSGEKRKVGGSTVDTVTGGEPTDLSFTTLDDKEGTLKRWFSAHHAAASPKNGTVGVPEQYAIKFKIYHGGVEARSARYVDIGYYRPVKLGVSLSRSEDAMEQLEMSFTQIDTFMEP